MTTDPTKLSVEEQIAYVNQQLADLFSHVETAEDVRQANRRFLDRVEECVNLYIAEARAAGLTVERPRLTVQYRYDETLKVVRLERVDVLSELTGLPPIKRLYGTYAADPDSLVCIK